MPRPVTTILIANRGEIAVRIIATLRTLGIASVAVFTEADSGAMHVRLADRAVGLGPDPRGYLDGAAVLAAARASGAEAIHPGYGFLSENADFARLCETAGVAFIGPPSGAIDAMGDKITAKTTAEGVGVPVVPGRYRAGMTDEEVLAAVHEVGYPALLKPAAGGGGKGMRVLTAGADHRAALAAARREAAAAFGDDTLMVERYLPSPRHIEVQVLADQQGSVVALADRECSLQRRHQKVIEEAPAMLPDEVRTAMQADAVKVARAVGYVGAGTVEFVVDGTDPSRYYFLEMNTRLQVEHPVTEEVFGIDLVAEQIRILEGQPLGARLSTAVPSGHAVEARLYAEDPAAGFLPTGGTIAAFDAPDAALARTDRGVESGDEVSSFYDPLLAKIICRGDDRAGAYRRLRAALDSTRLLGVRSNLDFLRHLADHPDVLAGAIDTTWIERTPDLLGVAEPADEVWVVAAVERLLALRASRPGGGSRDPWDRVDGWRIGEPAWSGWRMSTPGGAARDVLIRSTDQPGGSGRGVGARVEVRIVDPAPGFTAEQPDGISVEVLGYSAGAAADRPIRRITVALGGRVVAADAATRGDEVWIDLGGRIWQIREVPRLTAESRAEEAGPQTCRAPMPGTVISVAVGPGDPVTSGQDLVTVEAMKMEHTLRAPQPATVATVAVAVGDRVALDQVLVTFVEAGAV